MASELAKSREQDWALAPAFPEFVLASLCFDLYLVLLLTARLIGDQILAGPGRSRDSEHADVAQLI